MNSEGRRFALFGLSLVVAAVCAGLGVWQGRRLAARRALNRTTSAARALPEVNLNQLDANQQLSQRRIVARGRFDHDHSFVLRGRVEREAPGVQLVVPLRLEGRPEAVLVNRGFAPAPDAARPDTARLDRTVDLQVRGLALPVPVGPDSGAPVNYGGSTSWRRLDLAAIQARLPYPVLDVYLHETEAESRGEGASRWPAPATLPPLDDGPHLSYMLQWFGIGVAAVGFGILVLRSKGSK
ncbi:MAG TPA: SURF1 family protein [Gemmatimonadales bacterium]